MKYNSTLKSPKKEEQEVPDSKANGGIDIMDEFEGILGIEDEEIFSKDENEYGFLSWDFMEWDKMGNGEDEEDGEYNLEYDIEERRSHCYNNNNWNDSKLIKRESSVGLLDGFDDYDNQRVLSLNLNLNYQEVLDAWSDRGPLLANDYSLSMPTNGFYMGEVPVMEEERTRREASVLRYKEKRQTRLFSKKIRYQVRKLNADKRPRLKGRFVKRGS